ncbi:hypothetical protein, partial [Pseudomonas sp. 2995-3]|uniref:hypothetical protein n=1 Tax=Pseudomonas sp. 2995-3 TaxID=1712680 RepID=UPI0013044345
IRLLNNEYDELKKWKVIVVEGVPTNTDNHKVNIGPLSLIHTVSRQKDLNESEIASLPKDKVDVKAIVAAGQEKFDEDKKSPGVTTPKLFIYPLNPNT